VAAPGARSCRRRRLAAGALAAVVLCVRSQRQAFLPSPAGRQGAARTGGAVGRPAGAKAAEFQNLDAQYNSAWLDIEEKSVESMNWANPQTVFAIGASALYAFDVWRIGHLIPPTGQEAVLAGLLYLGLYASRYQDVRKLDVHYQVSFYASCGWTFYAFASLVHAMSYSPDAAQHVLSQQDADAFHGGAAAIYLGSCAYFYAYHWGRQWRHLMENRIRPMFVVGLGSLTFAHGLTVGHILKCLDDPKWFGTVAKIYPDEWQWMADTRLVELYLTAFALFLVICHLRGVLTGTANAAVVFLGTVIVPTALLFGETFFIKACAWEHYFMWGPKHW
jgi:hypothetical protein